MIIHELTDDGVKIGNGYSGTTRCGAIGTMVMRDGRRHIQTESKALFALSLLTRMHEEGPLEKRMMLELEPTTCKHCVQLAQRRRRRSVAR